MCVNSRFVRDLAATEAIAMNNPDRAHLYNRIASAMEEQEALIERLETGIRDLLRENQRRADEMKQQNDTIIALIGERIGSKGIENAI